VAHGGLRRRGGIQRKVKHERSTCEVLQRCEGPASEELKFWEKVREKTGEEERARGGRPERRLDCSKLL